MFKLKYFKLELISRADYGSRREGEAHYPVIGMIRQEISREFEFEDGGRKRGTVEKPASTLAQAAQVDASRRG
jgi:hypothetical protein